MANLRLVICVPSTHLWEAEFGMSLVFLTNHIAAHPVPGYESISYVVHNTKGSILANMRQWAVQQAIERDATHILFVDSDQVFPKDTVHRLIKHGKQVVAANVATKNIPSAPTARNRGGLEGVPVYTRPESTGLEKVWRVGTGVMLISMNIFKREQMKQGPWFDQPWKPELGGYQGEDWSFCDRLEAAGVSIYIDHDLSKEVGHMGILNYGHDLVPLEEVKESA